MTRKTAIALLARRCGAHLRRNRVRRRELVVERPDHNGGCLDREWHDHLGRQRICVRNAQGRDRPRVHDRGLAGRRGRRDRQGRHLHAGSRGQVRHAQLPPDRPRRRQGSHRGAFRRRKVGDGDAEKGTYTYQCDPHAASGMKAPSPSPRSGGHKALRPGYGLAVRSPQWPTTRNWRIAYASWSSANPT